jgi:hypothetical protein
MFYRRRDTQHNDTQQNVFATLNIMTLRIGFIYIKQNLMLHYIRTYYNSNLQLVKIIFILKNIPSETLFNSCLFGYIVSDKEAK